jgi:hypothetical protein
MTKFRSRTVTITLRVSAQEPEEAIPDEELAGAIDSILNDWEDGRFPFAVEQLNAGLAGVVRSALASLTWGRCRQQYFGQMVETPVGERPLALIRSERIMQQVSVMATTERDQDQDKGVPVVVTIYEDTEGRRVPWAAIEA